MELIRLVVWAKSISMLQSIPWALLIRGVWRAANPKSLFSNFSNFGLILFVTVDRVVRR